VVRASVEGPATSETSGRVDSWPTLPRGWTVDPPSGPKVRGGSSARTSCWSRSPRRGFGRGVHGERGDPPVRRKVALKVLKPGHGYPTGGPPGSRPNGRPWPLWTHANIAKVFDAGHRLGPARTRDWNCQGRPHHPTSVTTPENPPAPAPRAGTVRQLCQAVATRAPEGHHPPRPEALQRPRHGARPTPVVKVIDFECGQGAGEELTERRCAPGSPSDRHAPVHAPEQAARAGLDVIQRSESTPSAYSVRTLDRHDAVRQGAVPEGRVRRDPTHHPRGAAAPAE